ncbi:hypothetical protein Goklo_023016 [Gossypium klotzschianum]|uniref:Auxin response factor domain-containing protein n=1 Tax=Gossypium klotzschianum TaxID=34286 RepID=A0A7J8TPI0_9ROSI|nr:hypothetical protein [Gossypium klotzschianum]
MIQAKIETAIRLPKAIRNGERSFFVSHPRRYRLESDNSAVTDIGDWLGALHNCVCMKTGYFSLQCFFFSDLLSVYRRYVVVLMANVQVNPRGSSISHSESGSSDDDLYAELWKLCAGPLVEIPRNHERVFYFPQGHMEQLEASTNQELNNQAPLFNLPSKILCRVIHFLK